MKGEELSVRNPVIKRLGDWADRFHGDYEELDENLRAARIAKTPRMYVAATYFYSIVTFVVTLVLLAGLVLAIRPTFLTLFFLITPVFSVVAGYTVYAGRMYYPVYLADLRKRRINTSLPGVTSFMYSLSRGGMPLGEVLSTVSEYKDVFGEAAVELEVASRDINFLGVDVITAFDDLADETPSDEMSEFLNNFVDIISKKEEVSGYLETKSNEFYQDAEENQEKLLDKLAVLAEGFVVIFVAFPLFIITIMVIMGFVGFGVLVALRAIIYILLPLSALAFIILLDMLFEESEEERSIVFNDTTNEEFIQDIPETPSDVGDMESLEEYERRGEIVDYLKSPVVKFQEKPIYSLYLGIGLGILFLLSKFIAFMLIAPESMQLPSGIAPASVVTLSFDNATETVIRAIDDSIVEAILISLVMFAIFYQLKLEYLNKVEEALPGFLGRLSKINKAGISIANSLISLKDVELGVLNEDVAKMSRDIQWNANTSEALQRFSNRVGAPSVTRAVVLIAKSSEASGRISDILDTAQSDADLKRKLNSKRKAEMGIYVTVIYVSFLVFIVIIAILTTVFIPAMPSGGLASAEASQAGGSVSGGAGGGAVSSLQTSAEPRNYKTLFYHAAVIEALVSGLIAGKMAKGNAAAGIKHSFVLIGFAYVIFSFVLPVL
ncbi:MAG: type II secretion system F family protein [Halobacteria archaeon]